jgi:hypothetical protein
VLKGVEVELAGWFDGPVAIVVVGMRAPGIGTEDRSHIFERFYRMADHERVTVPGSGCRSLVISPGGWAANSTSPAGSAWDRRSCWSSRAQSPHVDPDVIGAAMTLALQHEDDRLEAVDAVRASGSRAAHRGEPSRLRPRRRVPTPTATGR